MTLALILFPACASNNPILVTRDAKTGVAGVPYSLPRSIIEATLTVTKVTTPNPSFRIALQTNIQTIPDPDHSLVLQHNQKLTRADKFKVTGSVNGLLAAINATSDDRTLEVVKQLAGAVAGFEQIALTPKQFGIVDNPTLDELLGPLVGTHTFLIPLPASAAKIGGKREYLLAEGLRPFGESVPISLSVRALPITDVKESNLPDSLEVTKPSTPANGVLTRARRPLRVRIDLVATGQSKTLSTASEAIVMIPDYSEIVTVPFDRAPFVKTVYMSTFADGVLTSYDVNRPSSAVAIASSPLTIMKAILEVPATLLELKVNLTNQEKNLVEAESSLAGATDTVTEVDRAIEQNQLLADYQIAVNATQAALAVYHAASSADKPAAVQAYFIAARDANAAAIRAGLAPPYDLTVVP